MFYEHWICGYLFLIEYYFTVLKVLEPDLSSETMAETRSQALLKEATVREVEGSLGSKIDQVLDRTQMLETTVADQNTKILDQNTKMEKSFAEMFKAIRLISMQQNQASASDDVNIRRTSQIHSTSPTIQVNHADLGRGRAGIPHNYSGMTRLTKLDFPRFNGERMKEWIVKVEQFFMMDNTPEDMKAGLASIHFDGLRQNGISL